MCTFNKLKIIISKEKPGLKAGRVVRLYPILILSLCLFFISQCALAQETNQSVKQMRHSVGIYIGILEINLNYERNIFQRPKSFSNLRFGLGSWSDMQSGGEYINTSFVHLLGKRKSHLEFDLGMKLVFSGTNLQLESPRTFVMAEAYVGYLLQYSDREYFRIGFSFPSLINLGGGFRF